MFTTCAKMLVFSAVIEVLSAISINTAQKGCSVLEVIEYGHCFLGLIYKW